MEKERKSVRLNKAFLVILCVLSFIGVLALVGGGILVGMKINAPKETKKETVSIETSEEENDDTSADITEEINSKIIENAANSGDPDQPINKNLAQGDFTEVAAPTEEASVIEEEVEFDDGQLHIVYLGDSIFDFHRDDGTSIPKLTSELLDADYINLAIGGTCASINVDNNWDDANWNSTSGAGVAKAIAGQVSPDAFYDCTAKELIKENMDKFKDTDIFVVEYGTNDYLSQKPLDDMENLNNPTTYQGGLSAIIKALRVAAPDAKIILCKPSYCEFWGEGGKYLGNYYVMANNYGTMFDYTGKVDCVDDPDNGIYMFDSNVENGINVYSAEECLEDGIHLTEAGRRRYADMLSKFILNDFHQDTDSSN